MLSSHTLINNINLMKKSLVLISRLLILLLVVIASSLAAVAQAVISGTVVSDETGEKVPYASVYVAETRSGVIADEEGRFILRLRAGSYNIEIRSMGYVTRKVSLHVADRNERITYRLQTAAQDLDEVQVVGRLRKEDPAYSIMRQLVARTPVYEHMAQHYTAEVYTKGSIMPEKIPFWMAGISNEGIKIKEYLGKRYVIESHIGLTYDHPQKYVQIVRATRSSVPEEMKNDSSAYMSVIATNIYSRNFGGGDATGMTNPIRYEGLGVYNYKLESTTTEAGRKQYRISYRSKSGSDISGEIVVADGTWTVSSFRRDVTTSNVKQSMSISLHDVQDGLYLPTTYTIEADLDMMGFKLNMRYYSALEYTQVRINESVAFGYQIPKDMHFSTTREARRHARVVESQVDTLGYHYADRYRLPDPWVRPEMKFDSLALKRDSSYWQGVVTVPLSEDEQHSYAVRDSLAAALERKRNPLFGSDSTHTGSGKLIRTLLLGRNVKIGKNTVLGMDGLLRGALHDYRYTDGLWMGQRLYFSHKFARGVDWTIRPSVDYTTHRRKVYWEARSLLRYAPLARGQFLIRAGRHSADLAGPYESTDSRMQTFITTISDGRGTLKLYDKTYLRLTNEVDIHPMVQLVLAAEVRRSAPLDEQRIWGISKRSLSLSPAVWGAKAPDFLGYEMPEHRSLTVGGALVINPAPFYRLDHDGRKRHDDATFRAPVFTLFYKQALPAGGRFDSDYAYGELSVKHGLRPTPLHTITYKLTAGAYFSRKRIHLDEERYIKADNAFYLLGDAISTQMESLPPYSYADRRFLMALTSWQFPSPIPNVLGGGIFGPARSALHLNGYWAADKTARPYFEVGVTHGSMSQVGIFFGGYNFYKDYGLMFRYTIALPRFR